MAEDVSLRSWPDDERGKGIPPRGFSWCSGMPGKFDYPARKAWRIIRSKASMKRVRSLRV